MEPTSFAKLPFIVRLSSLLTLFISWVCFAEFIIDRHGWDRFLPFYRVGNLCPYDVAVVALLVGLWFWLQRR